MPVFSSINAVPMTPLLSATASVCFVTRPASRWFRQVFRSVFSVLGSERDSLLESREAAH